MPEKQASRERRSTEIERPEGTAAQFLPNAEASGSSNSAPVGYHVIPHGDALEAALLLAAQAGRFDVVAQLAKEIEARRLAGGNVASLVDARRAKR